MENTNVAHLSYVGDSVIGSTAISGWHHCGQPPS
jgi:bifunctional N-acetylglucosamine-1-phosphate-uridyltransferase/glucosamine-1-phosphate-acetyltransferase GlmU-like protein